MRSLSGAAGVGLSLLEPATPADVKTEPFPHVTRTSALPAAEYASLAKQFPSLEAIAENAGTVELQ